MCDNAGVQIPPVQAKAPDLADPEPGEATILVVDDSAASAELLQIHLERAGYRVMVAHGGEETLARVKAAPPDLVILDVMMPGLDGFAVCEHLKTHRRTWFIPVILVTTLNRLEDRIQGIEAGADDFLSKPFNREELLARVRSLLRLKFANDAVQTERHRLALLYNISQEINSRLAQDEVLSKIVTLTREALEASTCSSIIVGEAQAAIQKIISREGQPPSVASLETPAILKTGLAGWVLQHRRGTIVRDTGQDRRWLILPNDTEPVGSAIAAPLLAGQKSIGVLLLTHTEPDAFDQSHLALLTSIAAQATVALANASLLEHTREEQGKLAAVLNSTADAVLAADELGNLILANPAAEQTFGLNSTQSLGQPLAGKLPIQLMQVFERVAASGEPISAEVTMDGDRTLYVSVSPVTGVGEVAVVQDITPLKELAAMRLKAEQEERERIHQIFERYVSPGLMDRILAQEAGLLERRERRDVVVLFADLRGFMRMTIAHPAHAIIEVLNEFFTAMVDVVYAHQGTVFDLAGDELMVGFGAPFAQEDASQRALHAAGDMQQVFASVSRRWNVEQGIQLGLGVGIDRGSVVIGNIGAPSRMNFGMVGTAVNTAHRLVELARHGEIIISEAVAESLGWELEGWILEQLSPVDLKGNGVASQFYLARPH
jgi:PAS domain S-box-containing protein